MARFGELLPALDPYRIESNAERVPEVRRQRRSDLARDDRRPGLSVIVLNKDRADLLNRLWVAWTEVHAEFVDRMIDVELLVGDTGSTDAAACELLDHPPPACRVWRNLDYHFSRCNNDIFVSASYQHTLFMNNDVLIGEAPGAVLRAYDLLVDDQATGALGAVLFFPDGSVQHGGIDFFSRPDLYGFCHHPGAHGAIDVHRGDVFEAPAATGAFLMMRSAHFASIGGFDERFAAECQDVDLCLRLHRKGLRTKVAHLGNLVHLENGTRELGEEHWDDRSLFVRRWSSYVEAL
jgi:GT2 family glycosyltransferase